MTCKLEAEAEAGRGSLEGQVSEICHYRLMRMVGSVNEVADCKFQFESSLFASGLMSKEMARGSMPTLVEKQQDSHRSAAAFTSTGL